MLLDQRRRRARAATRFAIACGRTLVGFVLDTAFVEPRIAEIFVSQDGIVLARPEGAPGASHFLGSYPDVLRNWLRLVAAAGLSQCEFIEAQCLFAAKIGFFGPTSA